MGPEEIRAVFASIFTLAFVVSVCGFCFYTIYDGWKADRENKDYLEQQEERAAERLRRLE